MNIMIFIEKAFELWMIDDTVGECPPGAPNESTLCTEDCWHCDECMEKFNRKHFLVRAWEYLRKSE